MSLVRERADVSLELARQLVSLAARHATDLGIAVSIGVVDAGGNLVTADRMDGAPLLSVDIAVDKAWTAVSFGLPTDAWWSLIKDDPALATGMPHRPRLVIFGGGVPLRHDGAVVGGIGVSGGSAAQDVACARAAVASIEGLETPA
ncbi:MAG TPA: heme-binding protein [Acidimicrobiales bacterium]|nr:heme-binding protein [Acidimicrobiales bacterium]